MARISIQGIAALGLAIDYHRFRAWLRRKYGVQVAYVFIGLIPRYKDLYTFLQKNGFTLRFQRTSWRLMADHLKATVMPIWFFKPHGMSIKQRFIKPSLCK